MVSKNTTDSSSYLLSLHRSGELELDFKPINATIGYHLPCHQRALPVCRWKQFKKVAAAWRGPTA